MAILMPVTTSAAHAGHYSAGLKSGAFIFVSGQLGRRADGGHGFVQPFDVQLRQALANVLSVVEAGGGSRETIVKVTAYIVGVEHWPVFDQVYAAVMSEAKPARTVVPVPALHYGYLVEVDAIALCRSETA